MKQVEITSWLLGNLDDQIRLLEEQVFFVSLRGRVEDEYLSQN